VIWGGAATSGAPKMNKKKIATKNWKQPPACNVLRSFVQFVFKARTNN
jgi:hypothetical protein